MTILTTFSVLSRALPLQISAQQNLGTLTQTATIDALPNGVHDEEMSLKQLVGNLEP